MYVTNKKPDMTQMFICRKWTNMSYNTAVKWVNHNSVGKSYKHNIRKIKYIIEDYIWYDVIFINLKAKLNNTSVGIYM